MVGFLKKFTQSLGSVEEVDIEEYLDTLGLESEHLLEEEADTWVIPYVLEDANDTANVLEDLRSGNIVLLNIEPLMKRNQIKLKQAVSEIKGVVQGLNGDIARLSEYKLLVTPKGVKVKRQRK
jgi:SepF-like predicted cell division protein (DUF552 family)